MIILEFMKKFIRHTLQMSMPNSEGNFIFVPYSKKSVEKLTNRDFVLLFWIWDKSNFLDLANFTKNYIKYTLISTPRRQLMWKEMKAMNQILFQ